jgi:class 3 adenylate cyclase/tetratricopeptide (TPR) repeat protein
MVAAMQPIRPFLERHGLAAYAALFEQQRIDLDIVADLTDADLERLGLPLGDRRRLLRAVATLAGPTEAAAENRNVERRQLTVLFTDLVDSTRLAGQLDPEDMRDLIARYQKAVGDAIVSFGGYVAKALGDGLLVYFGWPKAHEDDAGRAVRAALAAVSAVQRVTLPDGRPIACRVGIATGEVVVGDFVGTGVDEEGAVVGGTPNLAARLQGIAEENSVVVSGETLRLVGRQFAVTDLGTQQLKGFEHPVAVWRVDGERASESRFDSMRTGRIGRFMGREHEMGLMLQRWRDAKEGECQLLLIGGEAGIGKSRLVAECQEQLSGVVHRVAWQASPLHINTPLYPVVRNLDSRLGLGGDGAAERIRKLDAALAGRPPQRDAGLKFLAEFMSFELPGAAAPKPGAPEAREAALDLLADSLCEEARSGPLLLIVEDAHWLDATSQELIERALDRLQRSPAMVVVTYRPEFKPPWAQHANVGIISLSRLGRRDARAIVESLSANGQSIAAEIADDIVAKSDGIPLFVEELTGSALGADGGGSFKIPASLRDALSERLDRLGSAKEVAQVAAAFGREFSVDTLAMTLGRAAEDVVADLDQLTGIDVLFRTSRVDGRYTFRHALLQEAAYESMLKSRRREIHARIVDVLSRGRPQIAVAEPEVLASHLERAGDTARAAEAWRNAGHVALRTSAYVEAIGAFEHALALMAASTRERADTHRAVASAYFVVGDYQSVRAHLDQAALVAEAIGDKVMVAEISMQQGHDLVHFGGSHADSVRYSQRALDIAEELGDGALAFGARFALGQSAWLHGDFAEAVRVLTPNLPENLPPRSDIRLFGTAGSTVMDSMAILGSVLAYRGEFDRAFPLLDRAAEMARAGGIAFDIAVAYFHRNRGLLQRGDVARLLPEALAGVDFDRQSGLGFALPWLEAVLGYALFLNGETGKAVDLLRAAILKSEANDSRYDRAMALSFLADTLQEDPAASLEAAERGLQFVDAHGYQALRAELLRAKAAAQAATDPAQAEACALEGLALARRLEMQPEQAHALRVVAAIKQKQGQADAARELHEQSQSIYRRLGMTHWIAATGH